MLTSRFDLALKSDFVGRSLEWSNPTKPDFSLKLPRMLLVAAAAAGAALLARVRGGTLEALAATRFRWSGLVFEGLLIQVVFAVWNPPGLTRTDSLWLLVLSNVAIAGFILANSKLPGMLLAGLGLTMNITVILLNGAMPVSSDAASASGLSPPAEGTAFKHERMDSDTRLPWLGDVVPVPLVGEVWSPGDVVLAAGIARLVYAQMLIRRRVRSDEVSG
jgi:hypothetical protein